MDFGAFSIGLEDIGSCYLDFGLSTFGLWNLDRWNLDRSTFEADALFDFRFWTSVLGIIQPWTSGDKLFGLRVSDFAIV